MVQTAVVVLLSGRHPRKLNQNPETNLESHLLLKGLFNKFLPFFIRHLKKVERLQQKLRYLLVVESTSQHGVAMGRPVM